MRTLSVEYHEHADTLLIDGLGYSGELFREFSRFFATDNDKWIKLHRREDGTLAMDLNSEPPESRMRQDLEVHVLRAFKPGDVVVLRMTRPVSVEYYQRIVAMCAGAREETGVRFVILDDVLAPISREDGGQSLAPEPTSSADDAEFGMSESREEPR